MATWYVRTTGSDSNAGTSASAAFLTIGKAMTQASLAAGDTIYVGAGTYRLTATIAPTSMASMTYLYGDTDGSKTGDAGEVIVTNYGTNDSTAPTAVDIFTFASKSYWTIGKLTLIGGAGVIGMNVGGTSANLTVEDCTFWTGNAGFATVSPTFGTVQNITLRRCRFFAPRGSAVYFQCATSASGSDTNLNILVENCAAISVGGAAYFIDSNGTAAKRSGGITIKNCLGCAGAQLANYAAAVLVGQYNSTTYPTLIYNSLLVGQYGIYARAASMTTENYNVIEAGTPRTNVTAGANSISDGSRSAAFSLGHEGAFGGVVRPFGEPFPGSPLLTFGGTSVPTNDINGVTRPASGAGQSTTQQALGPFERANSGTKDVSTYRTASPSLVITGPGYHDFELPVSATATTFSAYVRWDSIYAGTKPSISVLNGGECGVANATATSSGSPNGWEVLSLSFTPNAAGIVTIRFRSSSTAPTGKAWIDDMAVS